MNRKTMFVMLLAAAVAGTADAQTKKPAAKPASKAAPARKAAPAVQPPWRLAYTDAQLIVTVDTSQSEKLPDGSYRTRMRWIYTSDQTIEGDKKYRTMIDTRLLDCKKVRSKPISATAYDAKGAKVSFFATPEDELPYLMWGKRTPGTRNDNAIVRACDVLFSSRK